MMKRISWTLTTLFALGVATVVAQQPGGRGGPDGPGPGGPGGPGGGRRPPPPLVEALDADHDRVISADELKNATTALLTLDKNKDGKLTENEFLGPMGPGGPPGGGGRGGRRGPQDDGPDRGREGRRGPGGRPDGPPGGGPGRRPGNGPDDGPPPPSPDRMVDHAMEFDADKDGKLSKEELLKFAEEFERHRPGPGGPPHDGDGPDDRGPEGRRPPQRPQRPD